jgi:hypothetical protein
MFIIIHIWIIFPIYGLYDPNDMFQFTHTTPPKKKHGNSPSKPTARCHLKVANLERWCKAKDQFPSAHEVPMNLSHMLKSPNLRDIERPPKCISLLVGGFNPSEKY